MGSRPEPGDDMPRTARRDYPGAFQHVTVRGIERRAVFLGDDDRRSFVKRLGRVLADEGTRCLAWALMTNHIHLLLVTGTEPLSRVMARLGTGYALEFNRRHDRVGHLFQNRYHSQLVVEEGHLFHALRYVHLNPVKAGIVPDLDSLDRYPWTGHRSLMGMGPCRFLDSADVLSWFHDDPVLARRRLRTWMADGLGAESVEAGTLPSETSEGEAASEEPREGTQAIDPEPPVRFPSSPEDRQAIARRLRLDGWDPRRLIREVCRAMGVSEERLFSGRKAMEVSRARAAIAWMATARLGMRQSEVAEVLGISRAGVCGGLTRGCEVSQALGLERLLLGETVRAEGTGVRIPEPCAGARAATASTSRE